MTYIEGFCIYHCSFFYIHANDTDPMRNADGVWPDYSLTDCIVGASLCFLMCQFLFIVEAA